MMTNLADWYWIIGGDTANVWSSARAALFPATDAAYVAWGRTPTPIPSMAELEQVFAVQFPAGSPRSYNADARYRRASGGLIISSISSVAFFSDPVARNTLANANEYAKATPHNTDWKFSDGSFTSLTPAQLATATAAMAAFVQSCFTKESENLTAINGGSMTTIAQIDAAFAAVPNVVP
jgi:hypothetical protein